jgi:transcription antitermination factor NusG
MMSKRGEHLVVVGPGKFQPKRRKTVRHARKLSTVEAPFFPRYLFIVLDLARHQWGSVNGTFGVSLLVMRGDQPHPVPRGVVEALIAAAGAAFCNLPANCRSAGRCV